MLINNHNKFKRYYKFKCNLIFNELSFNRMGIDALPRYFLQPQVNGMKEYMSYTDNPASIDYGYMKDDESGLYLKNIKKIDPVKLEGEYAFISMNNPYWFFDEQSYVAFLQYNFSAINSEALALRYSFAETVYDGKEQTNLMIPAHKYCVVDEWLTRITLSPGMKEWPKNKYLTVIPNTGTQRV